MLLQSQTADGGWGPHPHTPPEPFDTAIAVLALQTAAGQADVAARIGRGRAYLIRTQLDTGGWPETTRPAGGHSYAQHISTSGWAARALIETRDQRR
jgi:hypothetical protein